MKLKTIFLSSVGIFTLNVLYGGNIYIQSLSSQVDCTVSIETEATVPLYMDLQSEKEYILSKSSKRWKIGSFTIDPLTSEVIVTPFSVHFQETKSACNSMAKSRNEALFSGLSISKNEQNMWKMRAHVSWIYREAEGSADYPNTKELEFSGLRNDSDLYFCLDYVPKRTLPFLMAVITRKQKRMVTT